MASTHTDLDLVWLLLGAALVMLMQAGFCCLETGLVRTKNSINVAIKNLVDFCIASPMFWISGFAIQYGASWHGLVGTSGFFYNGDGSAWALAFFLFQLVFCGTSTTIVSGAVAERMRFSGYLLISFVIASVIYPVFGHWAWGGAESGAPSGWLARMGFIDFAGSSVVHSVGAWMSLACILLMGPRKGRFEPGAKPIQGHNIPMSLLGVFILWFGWYGFNGGSTLRVTDRIPWILVNTTLAAAAGALAGLGAARIVQRRWSIVDTMNGVLAGLVSITASCHIVTPGAALAIGALGGVFCFGTAMLLEKLRIDDAVGAVPVHGAGGMWGTLALAWFADPSHLGGRTHFGQFLIQCTGVLACASWAFGVGFVLLWLIDKLLPLRVSSESESIGLNVSEHGATTETIDLLMEMEAQRQSGDFSRRVEVEQHTEVGQIAAQYNRILDRLSTEKERLSAAAGEIQRVNRSLEEAERKYRGIVENAVEGIFQTSRSGQYLMINPALAQIYGYASPEELMSSIGSIERQIYVEPGRRSEFLRLMEEKGLAIGFESRVYKKDGSIIWISENVRAVRGSTDEHLYFEGTVLDISQRKRYEEELAHARDQAIESLKLKSEFLANISHELRTPLNAVIGLSDLLLETAMTDEQKDFVATIHSSGAALLEIINDVLDFSKIEAGKLELDRSPFDVRQVVEEVADIFAERAHAKGLELTCDVNATCPRILTGDSGRLRQVLLNLTGNALKFTEQGEVCIGVKLEHSSDAEALLRFEVSDTGIGIPESARPRLFKSFSQVDGSTTRKYGGTGLGLAISKQLVELMGGEIAVESEAGKGSLFWFTARLDKPTQTAPDAAPAPDLRGCRALIVDDNATNRLVLSRQLAACGICVDFAESGRGALERLREAAAAASLHDLIILDMLMPEMDGLQLAAEIQKDPLLSCIPLVMLTSLGLPRHEEEARKVGIRAYLRKPVRQKQLHDCLHRILRTKLPVQPAPAPGASPAPRAAAPALALGRVLLVEDNAVNQKIAERMLSRLGYRVTLASNGLEAVESASSSEFEAIVMDCLMPELDGFGATAKIRALEVGRRRTPIIAVTANALEGDREKCLAAGMDDYLSKPIRLQVLAEALEKWVARPAIEGVRETSDQRH